MWIIDIRSATEFDKERIKGSVTFPADEMQDRWFELPDKYTELCVVVNKNQHTILLNRLRIRFKLNVIYFDSDEWIKSCKESGKFENRFLYKPCPLLSNQIDWIEGQLNDSNRYCLDVGCGSGRDSIWLASRNGWKVFGLDCWKSALQRFDRFALRMNVSENATSILAKINSDGVIIPTITTANPANTLFEFNHQFNLIMCIRFLERSFFPTMDALLCPCGFILYSTFVCDDAGIYSFERPTDHSRILGQGELNEFFTAKGYKVCIDRISIAGDGRPIAEFLARKP